MCHIVTAMRYFVAHRFAFLSAGTRTEVTAAYQRRSSVQLRREFDGLRVGGAFFYEF